MSPPIRIVVVGDPGVGKSCLITSLIKEVFVSNIQHVLPPITIPGEFQASSLWAPHSIIIDTSANSNDRDRLNKEIRRAHVIWLVYSDHYSFQRISLFWLPHFRSIGVNVPIVLCANKSDLIPIMNSTNIIKDEMIPIMEEFKEIESCIRASAKLHYNVNQSFYLCLRAVTHPLAPLYNAQEHSLKPAAISALSRVFFLSDKDQDGFLNDDEMQYFQLRCFGKPISSIELQEIKLILKKEDPKCIVDSNPIDMNTTSTSNQTTIDNINADKILGITEHGFIVLNRLFIEKGRHETAWGILRAFNYTDSLSLSDNFIKPKLDVPPLSSVELSPQGYRFLVDMFVLFDKDNDGGLSEEELTNLFKPTPGIPQLWIDTQFPLNTVINEEGFVTLQGWLAQWSMTTFLDYRITLEYLAWLGFSEYNTGYSSTEKKKNISDSSSINNISNNIMEKDHLNDQEDSFKGSYKFINNVNASSNSNSFTPPVHSTLSALKVTAPRRKRPLPGTTTPSSKYKFLDIIFGISSYQGGKHGKPVNRNVFYCLLLGPGGCGKSALLDSFLSRPFNSIYSPSIHNRLAVNTVELRGGKQCYMIVEELGELEPAILENKTRLEQCDVICYTYDSSDPNSFQYIVDLRAKFPALDQLPCVYAALKADLDRQQQRTDLQPDEYTHEIGLPAPLHVSSIWPYSVAELYVQLSEAATWPLSATPRLINPNEEEEANPLPMILAGGIFSLVVVTAAWIWKNARNNS